MSTERGSVVVVGGGIVGCACAMNLAAAGCNVTVLDAGTPGHGATAAGMGHIVVLDDSPAQLALTAYSARLWAELVHDSGDVAEYDRCGTLWVACSDQEWELADERHNRMRDAGVQVRMLTAREVSHSEPLLQGGLRGAMLVTGDAVVYPPAAARFFLELAVQHGAVVKRDWRVDAVEQGRVYGSGGQLDADAVVIATGADGTHDIPGSSFIRKRRGHLAITQAYPGSIRHQIVEMGYMHSAHTLSVGASVAFNVQPRRTGQILIGSSRELGVDAWDCDRGIVAAMLQRAFNFIPTLKHMQVTRIWTGLRPASADGLPVLGPHHEVPGVWLALGHEGLGIATSLATGRLIAALLLGEAAEIDVAPFASSRSSAVWREIA